MPSLTQAALFLPTDNALITLKSATSPQEFELASIKPSAPDSPRGTRLRFQAGGRVDAEMSLKSLIIFAPNIPPNLADDLFQLRPENAGGMTVFEAVEKMLGLKLEQQTRAIPAPSLITSSQIPSSSSVNP